MAGPKLEDLQTIAFSFYDAVLTQDGWENSLQDLADAFGGSFATFEIIDKKTGSHLQHHDSSDLEIKTEYLSHFLQINPRYAFGFSPSAPRIMHDAQFITEREMNHSEFYVDFLRPHDLKYFLACKAYETTGHIGVFTIQKSRKAKPPSEEDLQAFNQLTPSLARVAASQFEYGQVLSHTRDMESVFEGEEDGVLILDQHGTVKKLNSAADRIVQRNDGVNITSGKLGCSDPASNTMLAKLFFSLSNTPPLAVSEKTLFAQRSSNTLPYQIRIRKCSECRRDLPENSCSFIAFIRDPDRIRELDVMALIDNFRLTPTEASVAKLIAKGKTAREISISLNGALPTIRTHIQRVLQKMGVTRQMDVVRILTRYL
mgnify:CR=1 FL=1